MIHYPSAIFDFYNSQGLFFLPVAKISLSGLGHLYEQVRELERNQ